MSSPAHQQELPPHVRAMQLITGLWASGDDARAIEILKRCRAATKPESKLLLIEVVLPPAGVPSFGKLLDIEMLVIAGGQERTEREYGALLQEAGFRLARVIPTAAPQRRQLRSGDHEECRR